MEPLAWHAARVNPADRLRIVTETARAVLEGRLPALEAVAALRLQQEQIAPHLRSDRIDVTQREAEATALTVRRLAEQISEMESTGDGVNATVEIAAILGELAQSLR